MLVRYILLNLPIHRRTFQEYYREHDREVAELKPEIEKEWGRDWEDLPTHIRIYWQDQWYWPPWYYNDTVGFLKIGSDGESALTGDIFLKRHYFPGTAPERFSRRGGGPLEEEEIVYLSSVSRRPIELGDNSTYLRAMAEIVPEAQEEIRRQAENLRRAAIWMPGFDLSCFDLARADRQLRERFPDRTKPR